MLISVHDLGLAKRYSNQIVGLRGGVKVLDDDTREQLRALGYLP